MKLLILRYFRWGEGVNFQNYFRKTSLKKEFSWKFGGLEGFFSLETKFFGEDMWMKHVSRGNINFLRCNQISR